MNQKSQPDSGAWSSRPRFTPRQVLTARQLNVALDDELMRQRLLNRAIHGFGVVAGYGLVVGDDGVLDLHHGCLELTAGLALDRHGRMLYWPGGRLGPDDIVGPRPYRAGQYTLSVHYALRPPTNEGCLPFTSERSQWSKEGVVFTLRPGCRGGDRSCPEHPAGVCISHDHYLGRRTGAIPGDKRDDVAVSDDVGWVSRKVDQPECFTGADDWFYDEDPEVCVPLACVEICDLANRDADALAEAGGGTERAPGSRCEPRFGFCPDTKPNVSERPFVYRSPLLYELLNDCDVPLSRVQRISWRDWIQKGWRERVPWTDFERRIASTSDGFEIWFTRPIKAATIHAASVLLEVLTHERNSDYWVSQRVPIRLQLLDETTSEQAGRLASGVRLLPDSDWLSAEVRGRRSTLFAGARFELTLRGQLLRDECDRMLDARPVDIAGDARGQAMPGGDFISAFRVGNRRDHDGPDRAAGTVTGGAAPSGGVPTAPAAPPTTPAVPPVDQATSSQEEENR